MRRGTDELQPVLKAMRGEGINIVAIHQHMTHETPRYLFLHYWGKGKAVDLAKSVKKALAVQQAVNRVGWVQHPLCSKRFCLGSAVSDVRAMA